MSKKLATDIVDQMYNKDDFSQWLGIQRIEEAPGKSVLQMTVRKEMTNGFDIAHGGISYAIADSALAFASNSEGRHAVSIETSISHTLAIKTGDIITAEAHRESLSHKIGIYKVSVKNQNGEIVALFKGTVYRKSASWEE